jgi:hemerythrin superfamily protein
MNSSNWLSRGNEKMRVLLPELAEISASARFGTKNRERVQETRFRAARSEHGISLQGSKAMSVRSSIEQATKTVMGALSPSPGETDILDTLQAEHDEVQDLLQRLNKSETAREQKSLVNQIKQALVPHTKAEEEVVYTPIAALSAEKAKIDGAEGFTEHALASATLMQLDSLTPNTPEFKAAAKVLKELIDHHVQEEERNIWAQVKENFSSEQREQMNRDFLAAKKRVRVP